MEEGGGDRGGRGMEGQGEGGLDEGRVWGAEEEAGAQTAERSSNCTVNVSLVETL